VDDAKRIIYIPRVCEVYRPDFTPSTDPVHAAQQSLQYCLLYLASPQHDRIKALMERGPHYAIRYMAVSEQYYSSLCLHLEEKETTKTSELKAMGSDRQIESDTDHSIVI
jgi:hypothetical protein